MNNTDFIITDFYNADHLNNEGAKRLSLKLNSLIKEIVVK